MLSGDATSLSGLQVPCHLMEKPGAWETLREDWEETARSLLVQQRGK